MLSHNISLLAMLMLVLFSVPAVRADKLHLKDGQTVEGNITKVEKGQVTIAAAGEVSAFDILQIRRIEFDLPALEAGTARLPVEHFLAGMEAGEMTGHVRAVEDSAAEVRKLIQQTRLEWAGRTSVESNQVARWEAAKERFRPAVIKYQEALNDLYFHVLGKVDEYNRLMKEANSIYVGVKGWFNAGSPLIPRDLQSLPLKKYVPGNWYDKIFYDGYARGYNDAFEKYSTTFHFPYEPPQVPENQRPSD